MEDHVFNPRTRFKAGSRIRLYRDPQRGCCDYVTGVKIPPPESMVATCALDPLAVMSDQPGGAGVVRGLHAVKVVKPGEGHCLVENTCKRRA